MNKQMVAMWMGVALLFASWIILPVRRVDVPDSIWRVEQSRFRFILNPDSPEAVRPVDWPCLLLIDAAITTLTMGMIATLRGNFTSGSS